MKKIISAAIAAVMSAASVTVPDIRENAATAADDTIKIMCIGDSITDGFVPEYEGSYRKFVYHALTEKGYNVDMVGTKGGGWTPTYTDDKTGESFEYDNENVGYSGYTVKSYPGRSGIYEVLTETNCIQELQPDIITLMIGTNNIIDNHDFDSTMEDYEELVSYILENKPEKSVLILSEIMHLEPNREGVYSWFDNYRHNADWSETYTDEEAEEAVTRNTLVYSGNIQAYAIMNSLNGNRVLWSQLDDEDYENLPLFDGVHPDNDGYKIIGKKLTEMIEIAIRKKDSDSWGTQLSFDGTTTTAATTTAPATTTTTVTAAKPTADEIWGRFRVSDIIKLSRYLLGYPEQEYTYSMETIPNYDLDEDGEVTVYDLVLMRESLKNGAIHAMEKFGEDFCIFEGGVDTCVIYPEGYEPPTEPPTKPAPSEETDWSQVEAGPVIS